MTRSLGLAALLLFALPAGAEDAKDFAIRFLDADAMGWTKAQVSLRLTITDKKKRRKVRAMQIKGATLNERAHTLVRFSEPAELAGTAMLIREEPGGSTTQLLYQPAYDKVRPIGAASKNERFMGTDFSFSDFEKRNADQGNYAFLPDVKCGKAQCRVVEVKAKSGLLSKEFGRIEFHVHPKAMVPLRTRFFAADGSTEVKSLTVNRLRKHQGRYVVFAATMKDFKRNSKTRIDVLNIDFAATFQASDFSESALRGQ
jgi:hypothetical protein